MELNEFITELQQNIDAFKAYWLKENAKNPEYFPLKFEKDNNGLWLEMFIIFMTENGLEEEL